MGPIMVLTHLIVNVSTDYNMYVSVLDFDCARRSDCSCVPRLPFGPLFVAPPAFMVGPILTWFVISRVQRATPGFKKTFFKCLIIVMLCPMCAIGPLHASCHLCPSSLAPADRIV